MFTIRINHVCCLLLDFFLIKQSFSSAFSRVMTHSSWSPRRVERSLLTDRLQDGVTLRRTTSARVFRPLALLSVLTARLNGWTTRRCEQIQLMGSKCPLRRGNPAVLQVTSLRWPHHLPPPRAPPGRSRVKWSDRMACRCAHTLR